MKPTTVELPYGNGHLTVEIPIANLAGILRPRIFVDEIPEEVQLLHSAMAYPVGSPRLRQVARPGQKVAIVTSDLTRPCPSARLLTYVLEELESAGIPDEDIFIVIALGLHRPMTPAEIDQLISPAIHQRIQVLNHDPSDTVSLGVTSRGTPVELFRPLVEADVRICLGNLEFHWF